MAIRDASHLDHTVLNGGEQQARFPGVILAGAAIMISLAMLFAFVARTTDYGATRLTIAPALETRDLRFTDLPDAAVSVFDTKLNREIKVLPADSHGFIKIVLKDLAQNRATLGIGSEPPFSLSRRTDGEAILEDTATGRVILLSAFGASNAAAFTRLLDEGKDE